MEILEKRSNHAIAGAARALNYGFPDILTVAAPHGMAAQRTHFFFPRVGFGFSEATYA